MDFMIGDKIRMLATGIKGISSSDVTYRFTIGQVFTIIEVESNNNGETGGGCIIVINGASRHNRASLYFSEENKIYEVIERMPRPKPKKLGTFKEELQLIQQRITQS